MILLPTYHLLNLSDGVARIDPQSFQGISLTAIEDRLRLTVTKRHHLGSNGTAATPNYIFCRGWILTEDKI